MTLNRDAIQLFIEGGLISVLVSILYSYIALIFIIALIFLYEVGVNGVVVSISFGTLVLCMTIPVLKHSISNSNPRQVILRYLATYVSVPVALDLIISYFSQYL